ncbi:MAG: helix-turn-helix transcriptional regulator [Phycisphaerae bacterium]|nr:helix-turn-helix transcriptional regulator [Phycisphaerae bacterium]
MKKNNRQSGKTGKNSAAPFGHLGKRLKTVRMAKKLTLDRLSDVAGVSKAMLSQIERDKVNPTVAVMLKIAGAMNVSVGELLEEPSPEHILRVIRESEKGYTYRSDPSCTIRTLTPLTLEKTIEFYRLAFEEGGELISEPHFPGTEEILHVTKGRIRITSGEQIEELHRGDSAYYRADVHHAIQNVGKSQAEGFLIVRYRET